MPKPIADLTPTARRLGFPDGAYLPVGQIRWLVTAYPVYASALTIARDLWTRAAAHPRPLKRAIVRVGLRVHAQNRALYRAVDTGRF